MTSLQVGRLPEVLAHVLGGAGGVSRLAPDVQVWLASPEQGVSAAIELSCGAEAATEALARFAPCSNVEVVAAVGSVSACWAEVVYRGDGGAETCVVGVTSGPAGEVSRVVWLRAPLVPDRGSDAGGAAAETGQAGPETGQAGPETGEAAPDGRPILERYFADLMSSRFRAAAAHFTDDTIYSHPPYAGGTERVLFEGRDALWRGFAVERGPSPARQIITGLWQRGDRVFVEGVIEGIPDGGSFFSTARISAGGEIARYVAFYSATRIPG